MSAAATDPSLLGASLCAAGFGDQCLVSPPNLTASQLEAKSVAGKQKAAPGIARGGRRRRSSSRGAPTTAGPGGPGFGGEKRGEGSGAFASAAAAAAARRNERLRCLTMYRMRTLRRGDAKPSFF